MIDGIIYIAFGEQYDLLAAHTISYSRQFTNLPISVISNIPKEKRCPKWDDVENVYFITLDIHQDKNRFVKTCLPEFTPFEKTIYLDCDSVIQRPGIEKVFDMLEGKDMVLSLYLDWKKGDPIVRIAKNVMQVAGVRLPLKVYAGAFICWDNYNKKCTDKIFPTWYELWVKTGRGRDLFQLCCSLKLHSAKIKDLITTKHKIFSANQPIEDCIVQHNYNSYDDKDFHNIFGLPRITENKPFDTDPKDWNYVKEEDV